MSANTQVSRSMAHGFQQQYNFAALTSCSAACIWQGRWLTRLAALQCHTTHIYSAIRLTYVGHEPTASKQRRPQCLVSFQKVAAHHLNVAPAAAPAAVGGRAADWVHSPTEKRSGGRSRLVQQAVLHGGNGERL